MTDEIDLMQMAGHLVRRLHQQSTAVFQDHLKKAGYEVTSVQYAAMTILQNNPGLDQARLAKHIAYDRATIGGVVKRLENKGLVTRNQSEKDRRAFDLSLSPKGKALLAEITPIVVGLQDEILPHLSPEEKDTVHDLMKKALCIRN